MKTFKNISLFFIMIHIAVYAFPRVPENLKEASMEEKKKRFTYEITLNLDIDAYDEDKADEELIARLNSSSLKNSHLHYQIIEEEEL